MSQHSYGAGRQTITLDAEARALARAILAIEDLKAWLGGDASGLSLAIYRASKTDATGEGAAWLQRCIEDNDVSSLRLAARTLAA